MVEWFNFSLYAIQKLVETVFSLDLGLNFSLGDIEVALLVIGMIATALVIKTGSFASFNTHDVSKSHFNKVNRSHD